jgi:eukaryotic-like serine/threonine-protein kinase
MIAAGTVLNGRYRLDHLLARGGFARVFLGSDLRLRRSVAIKVLDPALLDGADERDFLARFEAEAAVVAGLDHPHILGIHDYGEAEGTVYLVMPYLDGGTVADRLREAGRLPPQQVGRYLRQVAAALDYAHRRGLVHRDIKPQNLLLRADDDRLLLADFGIAKLLSASRTAHSRTGVVGTLAYMAPEQFQCRPVPATDIYALGCVLFQLLTGEVPYPGPTEQVLFGHVWGAIPSVVERSRGQVPAALQAVIARALAKQPEERYASAGDLAAAFQVAAGPVSAAGDVAPAPPPTRPAPPRVARPGPTRVGERRSPEELPPTSTADRHAPPAPTRTRTADAAARTVAPAPPAAPDERPGRDVAAVRPAREAGADRAAGHAPSVVGTPGRAALILGLGAAAIAVIAVVVTFARVPAGPEEGAVTLFGRDTETINALPIFALVLTALAAFRIAEAAPPPEPALAAVPLRRRLGAAAPRLLWHEALVGGALLAVLLLVKLGLDLSGPWWMLYDLGHYQYKIHEALIVPRWHIPLLLVAFGVYLYGLSGLTTGPPGTSSGSPRGSSATQAILWVAKYGSLLAASALASAVFLGWVYLGPPGSVWFLLRAGLIFALCLLLDVAVQRRSRRVARLAHAAGA